MITHLKYNLKGIGVENFRVFKEKQYFDFAPITILTGTNSSGKSSLINLLNFLKSESRHLNLNQNFNFHSLFFDDHQSFLAEKFGELKNVLNDNSNNNIFSIYQDIEPWKEYYNKEAGVPEVAIQNSLYLIFNLVAEFDYELDHKNRIFLKSVSIRVSKINDTKFSPNVFEALQKYLNITRADILSIDLIKIEVSYYLNHDRPKFSVERNDIFYLIDTVFKKHYWNIERQLEPLWQQLDNANTTQEKFEKFLNENDLNLEIFKSLKSYQRQGCFFYQSIGIKYYYNYYNHAYTKNESFIASETELLHLSYWCGNDLKLINELKSILGDFYEEYDWEVINYYFLIDLTQFKIESLALEKVISYLNRDKPMVKPHKVDYSLYAAGKNFEEIANLVFEKIKGNTTFNDVIKRDRKNNNFSGTRYIDQCGRGILYNFLKLSETNFVSNNRTESTRNFKLDNLKQCYLLEDKDTPLFKLFIEIFELGDDIKFDIDKDTMTFKVFILKNKEWKNLKDEGFGIVKLFPILLNVNIHYEANPGNEYMESEITYFPSTVIIEEPESNLHPALQSKLADFFVELERKFNIQFIIETHSEYFIRKLQYLTAKKEIKPSDTQLYYFHHPDKIPEGEKQIYPINIREDGTLTKNFGTGFFDEAGKQEIQLYTIIKDFLSNGSSTN